jgi:hypothetical protein
MHVFVVHRISEPESFYPAVEAGMKDMPQNMQVRTFLPSTDGSTAVCIWQADSVDSVRSLVDGTVGDYSDNEFFEGNVENAMGLDA